MESKVKLKDIAKETGVSIVTVSNALAGRGGVSDEIQEKIIGIAKQMGYDFTRYEKKDANGASLAVLVPAKDISVGNSFYWEMYEKVAYAAAKRHFFTSLEMIDSETEGQNVIPQTVASGKMDGIVIIGRAESSFIKKILSTVKLPLVIMDSYNTDLNCDCVISNSYVGMYKTTRYLINHGHKKIGFVGTIALNRNIKDRYFGYRKAMTEAGLAIYEEWILDDRTLPEQNIRVELPDNLPTAFACASDFSAAYLKKELNKRGLSIPEDISVTGYDNYLFGDEFGNTITTYNVDMAKMAEEAMDIMHEKMSGTTITNQLRYVDSYIVERSSVRTIK